MSILVQFIYFQDNSRHPYSQLKPFVTCSPASSRGLSRLLVLTLSSHCTCDISVSTGFLFIVSYINFYLFSDDNLNSRMTSTRTANKRGPSPEVQEIMKKRMELEYEFYDFVKERFNRLKAELMSGKNCWVLGDQICLNSEPSLCMGAYEWKFERKLQWRHFDIYSEFQSVITELLVRGGPLLTVIVNCSVFKALFCDYNLTTGVLSSPLIFHQDTIDLALKIEFENLSNNFFSFNVVVICQATAAIGTVSSFFLTFICYNHLHWYQDYNHLIYRLLAFIIHCEPWLYLTIIHVRLLP